MTVLDRLLRRAGHVAPDDPLVHLISRLNRQLEPDPLFRRRLRSLVVNEYVATREGLAPTPERRRMGRLGRAVLYASVALALTTTVAGAASQGALPGDALYAVKRRIEEIRLRVAPEDVKAQLLGMVLEERLAEAERLAADGRWQLAGAAAADAATTAEWLVTLEGRPRPVEAHLIDTHLLVLDELVDGAPKSAQIGLEQALEASELGQLSEGPMQVLPHHGLGSVNHPTHPSHPGHVAGTEDEVERAGTEEPAQTGEVEDAGPEEGGEPEESAAPEADPEEQPEPESSDKE